MKRVFLNKKDKKLSVGSVAFFLMATSLVGQVVGFLRVKIINANFNEFGPQSTDAFFSAFKIPDFFFYTISAGALGVAFIPVLADLFEKGDKKRAWELASSLLSLLSIVMGIVGVFILIFADQLVGLVNPGATPEVRHNSATIMRIIAFNPLLFTLSGIMTSVQQTLGRFLFYALAPIFYNVSILVSAIVFSQENGNNGGPFGLGITGLGVGALVGALLQFLVIAIGLGGVNFIYRFKMNFKDPDFRKVLRQLPPRSIDQGIDSINGIVEHRFAGKLGQANITYYENAFTLHAMPIQLIGTTISTAAFPKLSARLSQGRPDLFRKDFLSILRAMIWIAVPVAVVTFFARGYLARISFTKGSTVIATILGFLCGAIIFRVIYALISRYFYAQKDTWTPLIVSFFAIGLNIVLAWRLSRPSAYGVAGLAIAQTIVAAFEVFILGAIMLIKDRKLFDMKFWGGIWRILSVTGFSVIATYIMMQLLPLRVADRGAFTLGFKLTLIAGVTLSVHLLFSHIFGLEEAKPVVTKFKKLKRIVSRPVKIDF